MPGDPPGGEEAGDGGEDGSGDDGGVQAESVGEDANDEGAGGVADVAPEPVGAEGVGSPGRVGVVGEELGGRRPSDLSQRFDGRR